jgi:hypothetical protein
MSDLVLGVGMARFHPAGRMGVHPPALEIKCAGPPQRMDVQLMLSGLRESNRRRARRGACAVLPSLPPAAPTIKEAVARNRCSIRRPPGSQSPAGRTPRARPVPSPRRSAAGAGARPGQPGAERQPRGRGEGVPGAAGHRRGPPGVRGTGGHAPGGGQRDARGPAAEPARGAGEAVESRGRMAPGREAGSPLAVWRARECVLVSGAVKARPPRTRPSPGAQEVLTGVAAHLNV